jgi:hypothetical protein
MKTNSSKTQKLTIFQNPFLKNFIVISATILVVLLLPTNGISAIYAIENEYVKFEVSQDDGSYKVTDKKSGIVWESNPMKKRFGEAVFTFSDKRYTSDLSKCEIEKSENSINLTFAPIPDQKSALIKINLEIEKPGNVLGISYESSPNIQIERINLLDNGFGVKDSENGYLIVPVREGLIIPANSGLNFEHSFGTYTYEGCHMAMFGLVKSGSAVLFNWDNPYTTLIVRSVVENSPRKSQFLFPTLTMSKSSKKFQIKLLGKGGYLEVGKAYRDFARKKGWLVTWEQKLKENPERKLLFGTANIKLWSLLSRRMSEDSSKELSKSVNWTFDEASEVAEHIKHDLKIDKVLFTIGGWIHRGYDNQHPDILPAAPECGGNEKLRECAKRVMQLGYLFCLHDNYQDMYRDSPSWNEDYIMKNPNGSLVPGGVWAGGRAYLTCSMKALELAKRPQNLPAVKELTGANSYFIDTTYAAGLYECFDPKHPLTRIDDMKWKQALSDYARSLFGIFGSECGREWAIPHSDFFEGLTGVSGRHFHDAGLEKKLGAFVVPLFEVVYRNCIAMYGKYGYSPENAAEYVLDHIIYGRTLNYHNVPAGIYWKKEQRGDVAIKPAGVIFKSTGRESFEISYLWECEKTPQEEWRIFVHFTDGSGKILFQNDHEPTVPVNKWKPGKNITGPFTVKIPSEHLKQKFFNIRVGMFITPNGRRAKLLGQDDGELRYILGNIKVENDRLSFEPVSDINPQISNTGIFVNADNGWAEGMHPFDRFVKNTCEILSPLNEITSQMYLTKHEFLNVDTNGRVISSKDPETDMLNINKKIQRSVFSYDNGSNTEYVEAIVNASDQKCIVKSRYAGDVVIPKYGFLVESPQFIAFNTIKWNDTDYDTPTFFTIRSLDNKPITESAKLRVFHGFGSDSIKLWGKTYRVKKEEILTR